MRRTLLLGAALLAVPPAPGAWAQSAVGGTATGPASTGPAPAAPEASGQSFGAPLATGAPPRVPVPIDPALLRGGFAGHLEAALTLDSTFRALVAQREAAAARGILVRSVVPGAPIASAGTRYDTRGGARLQEFDADLAAPLWLPGQRGALGATVNAAVEEFGHRIALRRLEVASILREAYWDASLQEREVRVARDRLATSRDIARDVSRRAELGDIPPSEALLARNETLAAEFDLAAAETARDRARATYALLTGGAAPDQPAEPPLRPPPRVAHPALAAATAAVAAADARARLVAATPRDNPELGVFVRRSDGSVSEENTSLGLRLRLPFATEARNAPRRAEAEAERTRASAELAQAERIVAGGAAAAEVALRAALAAVRLARTRINVANEQVDIATRAYRAGETGAFELFRTRQLQLEAALGLARAEAAAGRARSRLNQAQGSVPGDAPAS